MTRLGTLLGEIHRRSVWQILSSYAVSAWIVLQLAETLGGLIGFPLWFGPAVVALVGLGFPILFLTSFLQGGRKERAEPVFPDSPFKSFLRRLFTWRNAAVTAGVLVMALGLGAAGYSGMRAAGIGPMGSLMAKGVLESDERLILADFTDRTPDGTLGETVTALFRIDLSQSTSVRVLEPAQLAGPLARMQRAPGTPLTEDVALELAQREGIKGVVTGEVLPLGEGAVISVRLVRAGTGETLVAMKETARNVTGVPEAVDAVSARLRERMGESLRGIHGDPPLHDVTTGSLDALRKYAQSERTTDQGDWQQAVDLLDQSLALDSTFAMAWRKRGILYQNSERDLDEARTSFTRAYQLRDRLTERERHLTEAAYFSYVEVDRPRSMRAYEAVLASYPEDRIALNNLAVAYGAAGEREKAVGIYLRAIRAGVAPAVTYTNLVPTLFEGDQPDSAALVLERFREAYPGNPVYLQLRARLAAARFDFPTAEAAAREYLEAASGDPMGEMQAGADLASVEVIRGKVGKGKARIMEVFDGQGELGVDFIPVPRPIFEGTIGAVLRWKFARDADGAARALEEGWRARPLSDDDRTSHTHTTIAALLAEAGRPARAREVLAEYQREVAAEARDTEASRSSFLAASAAIATAEGRHEDAIRDIEEARALTGDCILCLLPELGLTYAAAGRHGDAIASFSRYLDSHAFERLQNDNFYLPEVISELAASYEAMGEKEEAARHYRWLLDLWSEADAALQPRIAEITNALRRVEEG